MLIDLCISINDLFLGIVYKETEALKMEGFSILGLPTLFAVDCWYVYMSVCVCVCETPVCRVLDYDRMISLVRKRGF